MMRYPILVEGGITRLTQCSACKVSFFYLFRIPQYPAQKFSFATPEEELAWKQHEEQRYQELLKDQHLLVPCPRCRILLKKTQHSWAQYISEQMRQYNPFRSSERNIATVALSLQEEEAFQHYLNCVSELLYRVVRRPKESEPHFQQVFQTLFQSDWKRPPQTSAWCEDIFWKIAILDQHTFSAPDPTRIDKLFQAVYLLNALDPSVYPALPKKVMEFFSIEILRASRLIQQLGAEAHRSLFHF